MSIGAQNQDVNEAHTTMLQGKVNSVQNHTQRYVCHLRVNLKCQCSLFAVNILRSETMSSVQDKISLF